MPTTGSPTVRRRELGTLLRTLRIQKGWTAEQVAERLMVSPSKVSRLETGQRGASARDIRDLCDLYEVDEEQRQHLMELAIEGKQRAWWQPLGVPYSRYVGLEAEATSISDYGLGIMPGLLQTPDYARAVVRAAVPRWVPDEVERRVQGRIARQQRLFSEHPPQFEAVVDESVLHRVVGSPAIMRAQLERLLELSDLPNVTLRVIPYDAGALPAGQQQVHHPQVRPAHRPRCCLHRGPHRRPVPRGSRRRRGLQHDIQDFGPAGCEPDTTRDIITAMIDSYRSD